jgi:ATP-dependent RNA helicase DeaD
MVEMRMPTVEDVNVNRLTRFDDAITEALGDESQLNQYRDIIAHYVEHHDVLESDVSAALAIVAQGDSPLLLSPDDPRFARQAREREERGNPREGRTFRDDRPDRPDRYEKRSRDSSKNLTAYRIEVGKRHKVEPRQIVGALANEGGFSREEFGHIDIRPDFSIVELPANLSQDRLDRLSATRISGKLIEIKPDRGHPGKREQRPQRN